MTDSINLKIKIERYIELFTIKKVFVLYGKLHQKQNTQVIKC